MWEALIWSLASNSPQTLLGVNQKKKKKRISKSTAAGKAPAFQKVDLVKPWYPEPTRSDPQALSQEEVLSTVECDPDTKMLIHLYLMQIEFY